MNAHIEIIRGVEAPKGIWMGSEEQCESWISNAFLIRDEDSLFIIDSGAGKSFQHKLLEAMSQHRDATCAYLVNTHAHQDHIGNGVIVGKLRDMFTEVHYYTHEAGCARLKGLDHIHIKEKRRAYGDVDTGFAEAEYFLDTDVVPLTIHEVEFNGWKLGSASVLSTPGHTRDSVSVYFESLRALFYGDLLWFVNPNNMGGSIGHLMESVARVKELAGIGGISYLGGGHFAPVVGEREVLEYISRYEAKEQRLIDLASSLLPQCNRWRVDEYLQRMKESHDPVVEEALRINYPFWPSRLNVFVRVFLQENGFEQEDAEGRVWVKAN